jgi:hypothetical protein
MKATNGLQDPSLKANDRLPVAQCSDHVLSYDPVSRGLPTSPHGCLPQRQRTATAKCTKQRLSGKILCCWAQISRTGSLALACWHCCCTRMPSVSSTLLLTPQREPHKQGPAGAVAERASWWSVAVGALRTKGLGQVDTSRLVYLSLMMAL